MKPIAHGIYDALIDETLRDLLARHPELRKVFGKIDPEEQPSRYAAFVAKVLEQDLREESDPEKRLALCNRILGQVSDGPGKEHLGKHRLVPGQKPVLLEITPPNYGTSGIPRPHTPIAESSQFTGAPREPQLSHELLQEMRLSDCAWPQNTHIIPVENRLMMKYKVVEDWGYGKASWLRTWQGPVHLAGVAIEP